MLTFTHSNTGGSTIRRWQNFFLIRPASTPFPAEAFCHIIKVILNIRSEPKVRALIFFQSNTRNLRPKTLNFF
jgi:hypothetical protein